jgi:hypothetical protein
MQLNLAARFAAGPNCIPHNHSVELCFGRRSHWPKLAFSLFLSFGEAKERKDYTGQLARGTGYLAMCFAQHAMVRHFGKLSAGLGSP